MAQLVPDISQSLDRIFSGIAAGARGRAFRDEQEAKQIQQRQIAGQADILASGVGGKKEEAALLRLSALNPQIGNAMRQALERGDAQELAAANAQAEKGFKEATFLQNQESFAGKRNALISLGRAEAARDGGDPSTILKLLDLPEEQLNTEIQRMLTMGVDIKALTARTKLGPEEVLVTASGQEVARGIGKPAPAAEVKPFSELRLEQEKELKTAGVKADIAKAVAIKTAENEISEASPSGQRTKELQKLKIEKLKNEKVLTVQKEQMAKESKTAKADILEGKIVEAEKLVDKWFTTGFLGSMLSAVGGTDARNLAATVETIQANLGFAELTAMKAASPTGGALGQVSERELRLLTATIASLDIAQDADVLRKNLDQIRTHINNWRSTTKGVIPPGLEGAEGAEGAQADQPIVVDF